MLTATGWPWRAVLRPGIVALAAGLLALVPCSAAMCAEIVGPIAPSSATPAGAAIATHPARVLDDFVDLSPWHSVASDGVKASIAAVHADGVPAMKLDFDLAGTAGYALAHRALPLELPDNFEISFYVRGDVPVNNFQFKLVDASGDNVWWFNRPDFAISGAWRQVRIRKRQIEFAWGPITDRAVRRAASIEFVVAAGKGGGAGALYFSRLAFRELPPDPLVWPTPAISASSHLPGEDAARVFDGDRRTAWRSDPAAGPAQTLTIDFGRPRELGGLVLRWLPGLESTRYDIEFSDDSTDWRRVRHVEDGGEGPNAILLPDAETRFMRLSFLDGPAKAYALAELEVKDAQFGASPNAFFSAVARDWPRGFFSRGFYAEQSYWTLVGIDGGSDTGLLSEDGALEVGKGGFSIEPFIVENGKAVTWADVAIEHDLDAGYLPMPGVTWRSASWSLHVKAFASGTHGHSRLVSRYEIRNTTAHPLSLRLVLAVRPSQVNPPSQTLNTIGGATPINDIGWERVALSVDGVRRVFPLQRPDQVSMYPFDAGPVAKLITRAASPDVDRLHDDTGYASAAMRYDVTLAPHGSDRFDVVVPLAGAAPVVSLDTPGSHGWADSDMRDVARDWREKLNRVSIRVPRVEQPLVDTLRTALAHILITRDGPMLHPGTRSYARSWIRDGAMMADALLRLGHADVARDYLRWYAPHQFGNGKIPCCVDARGADPVPENDSNGEFIFLVDDVYRYTRDHALADAMWPPVAAAAAYLETLRQSERVDVNREGSTRAFYGLLPASISHEGYSEKPMHSYWDDFWAAKGYDAAVHLATALGRTVEARDLAGQRDQFREDLVASLRNATAIHGIPYLPGSAELGDFDSTSTSIAFAPGSELPGLPETMVSATFERYWREFLARRDGQSIWDNYTPYELRGVGTFVRLGWRDRAQSLLAFFMADRRPTEWNQWAEVVGRDPRQSRFVGDMPHGWIASDFIRSTLDLFAYERYADQAIVIAAGVPLDWLAGAGIKVDSLRTPYGNLSYELRSRGRVLDLAVAGTMSVPPGGLVFLWPGKDSPPAARINGNRAEWDGMALHITKLPAQVRIGGS